jgi:phosphopentomutase
MDRPFRVFEKFPDDFLREWLRRCGREPVWFGNYPASGTQIIDDFGEEHVKTGSPIVYTSADSVFQLAAHEEIIPLSELYNLCAIAREMFNGENNIGRIIARPFIGQPGNFKRTKNRRDYAVEPVGPTILDGLAASGKTVLGIGKIEDIFHNRGITVSNHTTNNEDGIQATADALQKSGHDLIFTNLVDFDMLYGHRNDIEGYAGALEYFDSKLPEIINSLHKNDVLFITADHGCDPTAPGTDHTREYVPILAYGQTIKPANLRTRDSFADLGATVYQLLSADGSAWSVGESFLTEISG